MQITADKRVRKYVAETGMLQGARRVIAGVSGGADSVFLFYMMKKICADKEIPFEVLHVHHEIRGREADQDAEYVKSLCEKEQIPFHLVKRDVPSEAAKRRMTLEEAGRTVRYELFEKAAAEVPDTRIALAHQKDDLAETMLFQLARGSGLKGLAGIRPKRGIYIRPLLAVTREEEEEWLRSHDISWRTDSTNLDDDAARNRIRHHVLPYLTREINAQTVSHMADTARIAAEASDFIEEEAKKRYEQYVEELPTGCADDPIYIEETHSDRSDGAKKNAGERKRTVLAKGTALRIHDDLVKKEPKLMCEEVIRLAVSRTLHTLKDVSGLHIRLILELFDRETGKYLNLPKDLIAKRERGDVLLFIHGILN